MFQRHPGHLVARRRLLSVSVELASVEIGGYRKFVYSTSLQGGLGVEVKILYEASEGHLADNGLI